MIKLRKLQHGDRLKLLPFVYENNVTMTVSTDVYLFDNKLFYDIGGKLKNYVNHLVLRRPSTRYLFLTYDSNGEILYTLLPHSIKRNITFESGGCDLNSGKHLRISKNFFGEFPSYSDTYVSEDSNGWSDFDKKHPSLISQELFEKTGVNITDSSILRRQLLKSCLDLILENFKLDLKDLYMLFPDFAKEVRQKKIKELLKK